MNFVGAKMRNFPNNPSTLFIGQNYIYLAETQSTNLSLKVQISESMVPEGTVISTGYQTNGKGQAGAVWDGAKDQNIMLSLLLNPKFINLKDQFLISKAMALSVHDFISGLLETEDVKVKWPNDILVSGQKICGILIENGLKGEQIEYCIVGMGININEVFTDQKRTSLKTITGIDYNLRYLEKILFTCIEARYLQLKNHPEIISKAYLEELFGFQTPMRFVDNNTNYSFNGVITGINEDGRLIVKSDQGFKTYNLKEISLPAIT